MTTKERYEYVKAIVDGDCLRWEYKLEGNPVIGRDSYDEDDVCSFTEQDILSLTCQILTVSENERDVVEIVYV